MDALISIASKVFEYTVAPIGHHLGFLYFYKKNVNDLKKKNNRLGSAKERLQRRVDDAERNGEEIEADVKELLTNVRKITEDNEKFIRDEEQANTKCSTGAFPIPNMMLRHRLSMRAKKKAKNVVTQIKEVDKFIPDKNVSYCPSLPRSFENKGYEEFETRNRTLADIMEALRDPNVHVLGVWGMGGVGKTMLAKEVARKSRDEEKLFSEVVFTIVSQTPNIQKIQEDIRKCLGMYHHEEIGERIQNRFRQENNMLVIVDDVWEKIELADVGISFGNDRKGCKILVTSRYQNVLNDMDVDKIFQVGVLLEDEAMSLFSKIVGDKAKESDFQALATKIVKECGGLPIAITTVASVLKNKISRRQVWKNALHELRRSGPSDIEGMDQKVYSSIKLSYDFLKNKEAKKLLLLCSLFEEDAEIPVELLCNYGIGLNLFQGTNKLEEATNKTITLIETLKDHSLLLLDSKVGGDFVRLHDVIRDVFVSIASKDDDEPMYNIRNAVELEEYLVKEKFKESTAISLYDIEADQYPETLKSSEIKLLRLICKNGDSLQLLHHFFEGLNKLLVLDLKWVSLEPLPASSFCFLQNLQTLRLNNCTLGDITWIGELNNLKILDLSHNSSITVLPKEIGKLNRLLSLNLQSCYNLRVIRPNVISRLTRLEELNLQKSFENWENGEGVVNGDNERPNANLGEVKNLCHLNNLSLTVPDVNILPNNMFSDKLEKFNIVIGTCGPLYFMMNSPRMLKLKLCPDSVLNEHDFEVLLKRSESLYLIGLKSVKSIAYELDSMGFQQLEQLIVEDSNEILRIGYSNGNMNNHAAFEKLRKIYVRRCNKMKSLFSVNNIPKQLERIEVDCCEMVEEIITDERECDLLNISELRYLELHMLPKLVQFKAMRKSDEIHNGPQSIDDSVLPLFNGEIVFPKLESLYLQLLNVEKIWNGNQLRSSKFGFRSLTKLFVKYCDKIKGLIPSSVARSLVHLQSLWVDNCMTMEEVVFMEESAQEVKTFGNISLPKLETLQLNGLPNLKRFCAWDCVDCSSLLMVEIKNCPKFQEFLTNSMPTMENKNIEDQSDQVHKQLLFNHKVVFPKLENLELEFLNVNKIWNCDQLLRSSEFGFQSLTSLVVMKCYQLKGLIPSSVARNLIHLQSLYVGSCKAMEEVFIEESTQEAKTFGNISFPKLETLQLIDLPNLKRFCAGNCADCSSLLTLEIKNCPNLQEFLKSSRLTTENENIKNIPDQVDKQLLFNDKVVFPELESLQLSSLGFCKIWNGDQIRSLEFSFQSLTDIRVIHCNELKSLIPLSVARSLVHLQRLWVGSCKAMEEIVFIEESTQEAKMMFGNILFPKLETLRLNELSNLERFCAGNCVDRSSLLKLEIRNCPKFQEFLTNSMSTTENEDIEELSDQVDKQLVFNHKVIFPKLESLGLSKLNLCQVWNGDQLRS